MFFVLSKLLSVLIHPFFWCIGLLILGGLFRKRSWHKRFYQGAVVVLLLFSNTVIFLEFARMWEVDGVKAEAVAYHDVAVVLGGMAEYNNDLNRLSIRRGGDRIWQAVQLYHQGKVGKILISGDNGHVTDRGLHEADQFKAVLVQQGIPTEDIWVEKQSKNTHENAIETRQLIDEKQPEATVLLVTSAIHMKRSLACFKAAGFNQITPFSTDHYTGFNRKYYWDQFIVPDESTLTSWFYLLHEMVGYVTYWAAGYL
jgi:uncharacterized SAM-binding protein YcdF (DUF218 family)